MIHTDKSQSITTEKLQIFLVFGAAVNVLCYYQEILLLKIM
jgi:hypothetical protein